MGLSGRCRSWLRLVTVVLLALALLSGRDVANAQEATTTATAAPTAPAGDGSAEGEASASQQMDLSGMAKAWLVGGLLVLAVVTVAMHYHFLSRSRQEYFRAASLLFQRGVYPQPVPIPAHGGAGPGALIRERAPAGDSTTASLEVIGPMTLMQGQQGVYVALRDGALTTEARWSVEPADAATLTPATGAVTNVSALREGTLALSASLPGPDGPTMSQTIAVPPLATPDLDAPAPGLPFIGQGFASLVGAVVLIAAVVVLAAIGVEDWAVIGTIFGALAGYLFGTTTSARE